MTKGSRGPSARETGVREEAFCPCKYAQLSSRFREPRETFRAPRGLADGAYRRKRRLAPRTPIGAHLLESRDPINLSLVIVKSSSSMLPAHPLEVSPCRGLPTGEDHWVPSSIAALRTHGWSKHSRDGTVQRRVLRPGPAERRDEGRMASPDTQHRGEADMANVR